MRIYNGTKSMLDLPLTGLQRLSIPSKSVSGDFMPTNDFLSMLVSTFDYNELAVIVSGPFEITMCANVSGSSGFVVQSLEEAIERFAEKTPEVVVVEEVKEEVVVPVVEEVAEEKENACAEKVVEAVVGEVTEVEEEGEPVDAVEAVKKTIKKVKKNK